MDCVTDLVPLLVAVLHMRLHHSPLVYVLRVVVYLRLPPQRPGHHHHREQLADGRQRRGDGAAPRARARGLLCHGLHRVISAPQRGALLLLSRTFSYVGMLLVTPACCVALMIGAPSSEASFGRQHSERESVCNKNRDLCLSLDFNEGVISYITRKILGGG